MKQLSWFHISDLHIKSTSDYKYSVLTSALFGDLDLLIKQLGHPINLAFFTGDIAFSGRREEYNKAMSSLTILPWRTYIQRSHIFVNERVFAVG